MLTLTDFMRDPRLSKNPKWWEVHYIAPHMSICDYLVYLPDMAGIPSQYIDMEKALWQTMRKGRMIMADKVVPFILHYTMDEICRE